MEPCGSFSNRALAAFYARGVVGVCRVTASQAAHAREPDVRKHWMSVCACCLAAEGGDRAVYREALRRARTRGTHDHDKWRERCQIRLRRRRLDRPVAWLASDRQTTWPVSLRGLVSLRAYFHTPWQAARCRRFLELAVTRARRFLVRRRAARLDGLLEATPLPVEVAEIVCAYV